MKIKRMIRQHRRDFYADYECQFCGAVDFNQYGYDDANFHDNVIPAMECKICGKSIKNNGHELDEEYRALSTKYPEGYQI